MPLVSNSPKGKHWERNSLPIISTITPGSYTTADITVDEYGRVVGVNNGTGSSALAGVNARSSGTVIAGGPFNDLNFNGSNISATNAGSGQLDITISAIAGVTAMSNGVLVPNGPFSSMNFIGTTVSATDGGSGQLNVTVNAAVQNYVGYVTDGITTVASQTIGSPIPAAAMVIKVVVTIDVAYSVGATIEIKDGAGTVMMPSNMINPQVTGTYIYELPVTALPEANQQMYAIIGGSPSSGNGLVNIYYNNP